MAREELLKRGWRRHSVISSTEKALSSLSEHLVPTIQELFASAGAIAVVTTYDCAVISPDFEGEPWVQLLIAIPSEFNKQFSNGRSPRKIHFQVEHNGEKITYEAGAQGFCQADRKLLLQLTPDQSFNITPENRYQLKNWLAERFRQDTWPDAFNMAIKPGEKKLKKLWARYNDFIAGMYICLNTYDDPPSEPYQAAVILAVEEGKLRPLVKYIRELNPQLKNAEIDEIYKELYSQVETAFGDSLKIMPDTASITGKAIVALEESEITISQLKQFQRFSPYSMSDFESEAPAPLGIHTLEKTKR